MSMKRTPHHDLVRVKAKFATIETLEATGTAIRNARDLGYSLSDIVAAVQALRHRDFVIGNRAQPAEFQGMARHLQSGLG